MKRIFLFSMFVWVLLASLQPALAEADSVMMATSVSYPDALMAGSPASKEGMLLVLTERERLSPEPRRILGTLKPNRVFIIGGPEVVSDSAESEVESMEIEVVRLFGITRYGTSAEVARYFWPEGSDIAVIAEDVTGPPRGDYHRIVHIARELSKEKAVPLLLMPNDKIPAETQEALEELGVKKIYLVGNFDQTVIDSLEALGLEIVSTYSGDTEDIEDEINDVLGNQIGNKTENQTENNTGFKKRHLVVVAAANFGHVIMMPPQRRGVSYLITDESQIEKLINFMNTTNITIAKVVGKPDLAEKIIEELEEAGITVEDFRGDNPKEPAEQEVNANQNDWEELRKKFKIRVEKMHDRLKTKTMQAANRSIWRLNITISEIDDMISQQELEGNVTNSTLKAILDSAKIKLNSAQAEFNAANYLAALRIANSAFGELRLIRWLSESKSEREEEIESDVENLKERAERIKEKFERIMERLQKLINEGKDASDAMVHLNSAQMELMDLLNRTNETTVKNAMHIMNKIHSIGEKLRNANMRHDIIKGVDIAKDRVEKMIEQTQERLNRLKETNNTDLANETLQKAQEKLDQAKEVLGENNIFRALVLEREARFLLEQAKDIDNREDRGMLAIHEKNYIMDKLKDRMMGSRGPSRGSSMSGRY